MKIRTKLKILLRIVREELPRIAVNAFYYAYTLFIMYVLATYPPGDSIVSQVAYYASATLFMLALIINGVVSWLIVEDAKKKWRRYKEIYEKLGLPVER